MSYQSVGTRHKYKVTKTCGHVEDVWSSENHDPGDEWFEWQESHPCTSCRMKTVRAEERELGLEHLKGTVKQVVWAHDIRKHMIEDLEFCQTAAGSEDEAETYQLAVDDLKHEVAVSAWLIEHRDLEGAELRDVIIDAVQDDEDDPADDGSQDDTN